MQWRRDWALAGAVAFVLLLPACTAPVEFSLTGANANTASESDDLDFGPMDQSMAQCKATARSAGRGKCIQVRAYEACMKTKGYITVLGPENPQNCGQPAWEEDVRKWLQ